MNIIVTGAAGFLGSHLCDDLLSKGYKVLGIDNFFRGKKENLPNHPNFKFIKCDLRNLSKTQKIFNEFNPEIVIHYAAINGTRYFYDIPYKLCDDNIVLTQNILKSCSDNVKKVVYASSSEVYGAQPQTPTKETEPIILNAYAERDSYASSKAIGEFLVKLWAQENNKKYLIVRPFNTYGPRMATNGYGQVIPEFIERIKSNSDFYLYGDGEQTRSFCYVKDHTSILVGLLEKVDNGIFNIGFDEEVTINELAFLIHKILNKPFNVKYKEAWAHDTKWRKPCLEFLQSYVAYNKFISLEEGIIKTLAYYE